MSKNIGYLSGRKGLVDNLFEFTAHESCGKCFPIRLGSTRGAEMLAKARISDYSIVQRLSGNAGIRLALRAGRHVTAVGEKRVDIF